MKLLHPIICFILFSMLNTFSYAQNESCFTEDCQTNVLDISTGVDQNNGTLYPATDPATAQDGFWSLINAPANQNVNFGPAWVIDPNGAWTTTSSSGWISAFNVDDLNANNPAPANPYTFQRCFCVCEDTELTFDFTVYADDQVANIWLDGNLLIPTPPYTPGSSSHFVNGVKVNITIPVTQGEHCLDIDIRNQSGVAMGLMLTGEVTGANLLSSTCCDNTGSICGFKFNDVNQNGVWDPSEPPLANWTIELTAPDGTTQTIQTDQNGNYCFNNLEPGTYTVVEVNQNGWTQTLPPPPGSYTINLNPNEVISNINFGNFQNEGCDVDVCNTNVLDVSTGVDQNNGTLYPATDPATAQDGFWSLINAPANQNVNFGPAWVIDPNGAWTTTTTSGWISAFNVDDNNTNNAPPANPYTFQRCFCVCEDTELTFDFTVYADDQVANIWLDGNMLIPTPAYTLGSTAHFVTGIPVNVTIPVTQGEHCMSIDVRNRSNVAMGLMVDGEIIGANLLTSVCCNNSGSICGFKFDDANQNGVWDNNESSLPNWTIELNGPNGSQTQQTDQFGNYCFNDLAPGTYVVSEINQPGWIQSFPAGGTHTITLGNNQVASGTNFGNYQEQGEPCELKAKYKVVKVEGCYVELLDASFLASGTIVSTTWDFGDGTIITGGPSVSHFYNAPGVYNVCLTVLAIVDGECCEDTYCQKIEVEGCHPEPCKIEVGIKCTNSDCTYNFDGTILFANTNIDIWFWDFGDGTTGNGQQVSHTYNPGSYVVCLTAIVKPQGDEDCCLFTICKEIFVKDCQKPLDGDTTDTRMGQEDGLKDGVSTKKPIELYPNPTTSVLHLKTQFEGKYQISIFDITGRQLYMQSADNQIVEMDLQKIGLGAGVYLIEVNNGKESIKEKFIFQQ